MSLQGFIQTVIFTSLLASYLPCQAEDAPAQTEEDKKVYRKFHPDGVVEFTDQPTKGSEELKVEQLPTYKFAIPPARVKPASPSRPAAPTARPSPYTALSITSPSQDESIRSNTGELNVSISLTPGLLTNRGHMIEYLLDGKTVLKSPQPQSLKNIDRGTHTLQIRIIDNTNKVLIQSDVITFHLQRFFKKPAS